MHAADAQVPSPVTDHPRVTDPAPELREPASPQTEAETPKPAPRWRPAKEPTCCGSGCDDCPF
jgi:hypothetical protein